MVVGTLLLLRDPIGATVEEGTTSGAAVRPLPDIGVAVVDGVVITVVDTTVDLPVVLLPGAGRP